VDDLIECALQKRRVDRGYRFQPFASHPGAERDRVLLGDADIECTLGEFLQNFIDTRPVRHCRSERDDRFVIRHQLAHRFAEDGGV
jgi:hypothetical protein